MQKNERNLEIDSLRGISIFAMILIHTSVYFLHIPLAFALWDISEFAVPAFIFCSVYIFFSKFESLRKIPDVHYVWKRIKRLLIPYYFFLAVNLLFIYIGQPKRITFPFILKNLFVIGGIDFNWLVLLFVELIPIMILLEYLGRRSRFLFFTYSFIAFTSSFLLLFFKTPVNYRYIMWLPWSTVAVFARGFIRNEKKHWFFPVASVLSLIIFLFSRVILLSSRHSVVQFHNKYPPNLFHVSFGIFSIVILYFLFQQRFFKSIIITKPIHFLSRYSYEIFFIHILVVYILTIFFKMIYFTWISFFIVVFSITIGIQLTINKIKNMFRLID